MKHCHFSILYNELPFLKQKLPFLYAHFDQIIFYDLNIESLTNSNDGSIEFIKYYPDPQKKITLIKKADLNDVNHYEGYSFIEKRKMFAVGSTYVRDDMDVFWCTDMDEFFTKKLIEHVEQFYRDTDNVTILVPHIVFFRNEKFVFSTNEPDGDLWMFPWARITKHNPGQLYGHCSLSEQFLPVGWIFNEPIYHFSYIGIKKVQSKVNAHGYPDWVNNIWIKFDESKLIFEGENMVHGFPYMHPVAERGIKLNTRKIPNYISPKEMIRGIK